MKTVPQKILKVLFVDDDSDESYLFNEALEQSKLPIELSRALDGNQLLKALEGENIPDIILMDINMPYKDGIEALEEIRSNKNFNNIHIIIYSITKDMLAVKKAYEKGADMYLVKPENFDGMLEVVNRIYSMDWNSFIRPSRENFVLDLNSY